ncbi:nitronate monooxygenase family protein [Anaerococcus porci]|uniref:NAD(P)H-dependent flavin oxidoreductase n=1 Tax=Anaerococcus porci TaxID=2652269 RepID=UPI002A75FA3A|nr:nitronate monooxygenase family protein [Anaerococcus porci]MDY3006945.1 nitronate monooxygenase family protein [Anaerococcus porci]
MNIKIKNKYINIPIIQGAMAIGMSNKSLVAAVANRAGIGTLSMVNPGYAQEDFMKNPFEANKRAFIEDLKFAREKSNGRGLILTNLMHVVERFNEYLEFLNSTDVDGVVVGAGLPLELPKYISEEKIIGPIVSSERALKIIMKKWVKYKRKPDLIILEGPKAGGHLGFKREDLKINILDELKKIIKLSEEIPVFVGGGFGSPQAMKKALKMGASGVQIGTGFLFTEESGMPKSTKEKLLKEINNGNLKNVILESPVGLLARGIENKLVKRMKSEKIPPKRCISCIKTCKRKDTNYCISEALINAVKGDIDNGLFFAGTDVENIEKVRSVDDYIDWLLEEK